jgi:hypothetical protein
MKLGSSPHPTLKKPPAQINVNSELRTPKTETLHGSAKCGIENISSTLLGLEPQL